MPRPEVASHACGTRRNHPYSQTPETASGNRSVLKLFSLLCAGFAADEELLGEFRQDGFHDALDRGVCFCLKGAAHLVEDLEQPSVFFVPVQGPVTAPASMDL